MEQLLNKLHPHSYAYIHTDSPPHIPYKDQINVCKYLEGHNKFVLLSEIILPVLVDVSVNELGTEWCACTNQECVLAGSVYQPGVCTARILTEQVPVRINCTMPIC